MIVALYGTKELATAEPSCSADVVISSLLLPSLCDFVGISSSQSVVDCIANSVQNATADQNRCVSNVEYSITHAATLNETTTVLTHYTTSTNNTYTNRVKSKTHVACKTIFVC